MSGQSPDASDRRDARLRSGDYRSSPVSHLLESDTGSTRRRRPRLHIHGQLDSVGQHGSRSPAWADIVGDTADSSAREKGRPPKREHRSRDSGVALPFDPIHQHRAVRLSKPRPRSDEAGDQPARDRSLWAAVVPDRRRWMILGRSVYDAPWSQPRDDNSYTSSTDGGAAGVQHGARSAPGGGAPSRGIESRSNTRATQRDGPE